MTRTQIPIRSPVLAANQVAADANRTAWTQAGITAINVMASPGAGKTTLITALLKTLPAGPARGVIEGDVASQIDTDKIRALGFAAEQITTDGGCHLTAQMVQRAWQALRLPGPAWVFIENIGNLICPVAWDLGESVRLALASLPEGDDKPRKYPALFQAADAVVVTKADAAPLFDFDPAAFAAGVRVLGDAPIFTVSARTGAGLPELAAWLATKAVSPRPG